MPRPRFFKLAPDRQQEILDASAAEFAESGFHGASLNRIQSAMGLSKGAFYYWFDDKEDLFLATLEQRLGRLVGAVGGLMAGEVSEAPFFEQAHASIEGVFRYALCNPADLALIKASMALGPGSSPRMAALWSRGTGAGVGVLAAGQARGEVRTDLPAALLSAVVLGLLESLDRYLLTASPDLSTVEIAPLSAVYVGLLERLLRPE